MKTPSVGTPGRQQPGFPACACRFCPARRTFLQLCGALVLTAAATGCQLLGDRRERDTQRVDLGSDERVFIGNVSLVNEKAQFVLIKTPLNRRLEPGLPLQSFRDGQLSAELLFSPEQSFGFMTADISEGFPQVGDMVFLRYTEDFGEDVSPRMQHAIEQHQREQEMGFLERRKYQREQKKAARKSKRGRGNGQ